MLGYCALRLKLKAIGAHDSKFYTKTVIYYTAFERKCKEIRRK